MRVGSVGVHAERESDVIFVEVEVNVVVDVDV